MALRVRQVSLDTTAGFTEKVQAILAGMKETNVPEETT
jgi:hypothetical protein